MPDSVKTADYRPSPQVIATRGLRKLIKEGGLSPGEKLPAEQTLAAMFKVSRGTVRSALQFIEQEGLIQSEKYQGKRVTPAARSSSKLLGSTLALVSRFQEESFAASMHSGYMEAVEAGAIEAAHQESLHVLTVHPTGDPDRRLTDLLHDRPKGVLVTHNVAQTADGQAMIERLHGAGVPLVVNGGDEGAMTAYDRVVFDHEQGAYEVTRWLLKQGRKRILRVNCLAPSHQTLDWIERRNRGYERAMREAGVEPLPPLTAWYLEAPSSDATQAELFESRMRQVAGYLVDVFAGEQTPDAMMTLTDGHVAVLAAACRLFHRVPNQDVVIAGYDNYWASCWERQFEAAAPAVTVDKHNHETGQRMVQLLLDRLAGRLPDEPQCATMEPELVVPGRGEQLTNREAYVERV